MRRGLLLLVATLVACCAAPAANPDPFTGTWKLNLEKSKLPPPVPQSRIVHLTVDGNKISVHEETTYASGRVATLTLEAKLDGKDYPVTGAPSADTMAYHRSGKRAIHGVAKLGGSVIQQEDATISDDGQTMTTVYTWQDAEGTQVTATAVFERQG